MLFDQGVRGVAHSAVCLKRVLALNVAERPQAGRAAVGGIGEQFRARCGSRCLDLGRGFRGQARLEIGGRLALAAGDRCRQVCVGDLHRAGHAHNQLAHLLVEARGRRSRPFPARAAALMGTPLFAAAPATPPAPSAPAATALAAAIASSVPLRSSRSDLIFAVSSARRALIAFAACSIGVTPKTSARWSLMGNAVASPFASAPKINASSSPGSAAQALRSRVL